MSTLTHDNESGGGGLMGIALGLISLVVAMILMGGMGLRTPELPRLAPTAIVPLRVWVNGFAKPVVVPQAHAEKHTEASAIRQCLSDDGNLIMAFKAKNDDTFYLACQLPDGRWGIQAIIKDGLEWFEKTAYVRGSGTWDEVILNYLMKFATRWKGALP